MKPLAPTCPYCRQRSELVSGDIPYPHRPEFHPLWFYHCAPCEAWVGTHAGSAPAKPLGTLANAPLRAALQRAHAAFDPLWQRKMARDGYSKRAARMAAYTWLARQLGIDVDDCHIGLFDEAQCAAVVAACAPYRNPRSHPDGSQHAA